MPCKRMEKLYTPLSYLLSKGCVGLPVGVGVCACSLKVFIITKPCFMEFGCYPGASLIVGE